MKKKRDSREIIWLIFCIKLFLDYIWCGSCVVWIREQLEFEVEGVVLGYLA